MSMYSTPFDTKAPGGSVWVEAAWGAACAAFAFGPGPWYDHQRGRAAAGPARRRALNKCEETIIAVCSRSMKK